MESQRTVAVFGAYGHTGRFVVAELRSRGLTPVLVGRDADKLHAFAAEHPGLPVRQASADDPAALDAALAGAAAVINAAGPFAHTAGPVIEAALRAEIPYVDVAAEVEAVVDIFTQYGERARTAGALVVPSVAFFGGLGDLLATAALGAADKAEQVNIAYALSSWHPTDGTRASTVVSRGRRDSRRLVYRDGALALVTDSAPESTWSFPDPIGSRDVVGEFTTADSVTIPRHLGAGEINTYMTVDAVKDVLAPDANSPQPVDELGRSEQTFLVDVTVRADGEQRRVVARGQDIYAISAPLAVEAVERILAGQVKAAGVVSVGEAFDAREFLAALAPELQVEYGG
ncbi:saccharopine dehydrogenase NADP-binding domain-containing protein [Streptomyces sp. NBC_01304]|uniref:saccharopine dehydrogenase NADP-binding domain-containing protein n=1 Tax=Streptomyces sp. NBC_01304 TaxID=2903818 RepID=UPI002E0D4443|nr:saccharopine dehydrogenase NADP-binding domain-containing protein [Streptomyces sp. NBC_01304]